MPILEISDGPRPLGRLIRCAKCGVTTNRAPQIFTPDEGFRRVLCGMCVDRGWSFDPDGKLSFDREVIRK